MIRFPCLVDVHYQYYNYMHHIDCTSFQAKCTKSTSFLTCVRAEVDLVPRLVEMIDCSMLFSEFTCRQQRSKSSQ